MASVSPQSPRTGALRADTLMMIGRELIHRGEIVFKIEVIDGQVSLLPVSHWDVRGKGGPISWQYRCDLPSPSGTKTVPLSGAEILHFVWSSNPIDPWRGIGPLSTGSTTSKLLGKLESGLVDESNIPTGNIFPFTGRMTTEQSHEIQQDFAAKDLRGRVLRLNDGGGWSSGSTATPRARADITRTGPAPPSGLVELRRDVALSIYAACGIPSELASVAEGTGAREGWRRFLHGTAQPVADTLATEASRKLGTDVSFSFDKLFASDLSGRARAFQSLTGGGMDVAKAAGLSGLLEAD